MTVTDRTETTMTGGRGAADETQPKDKVKENNKQTGQKKCILWLYCIKSSEYNIHKAARCTLDQVYQQYQCPGHRMGSVNKTWTNKHLFSNRKSPTEAAAALTDQCSEFSLSVYTTNRVPAVRISDSVNSFTGCFQNIWYYLILEQTFVSINTIIWSFVVKTAHRDRGCCCVIWGLLWRTDVKNNECLTPTDRKPKINEEAVDPKAKVETHLEKFLLCHNMGNYTESLNTIGVNLKWGHWIDNGRETVTLTHYTYYSLPFFFFFLL